MARPTIYKKELAEKLCDLIASSSKGLLTILDENSDLPKRTTIYRWLKDNEEFREMYVRAREDQADYLADEMLEISDHSEEDHTPFTGVNVVQRDKLRIETRKWIAAKLKPTKYGEKLDIKHEGEMKIEHVTGMIIK